MKKKYTLHTYYYKNFIHQLLPFIKLLKNQREHQNHVSEVLKWVTNWLLEGNCYSLLLAIAYLENARSSYTSVYVIFSYSTFQHKGTCFWHSFQILIILLSPIMKDAFFQGKLYTWMVQVFRFFWKS